MFQIDLKSRTINLIGFSGSIQHYVDDGKGPPPMPQGAQLNPGVNQPIIAGQPFPGGGFIPPNGCYSRVIAANNTGLTTQAQYWSFSTYQPLSAGTHTFSIYAAGVSGSGSAPATAGGDTNSTNQGELTVVLINP